MRSSGTSRSPDAGGFVLLEALVALILISMTLALFATSLNLGRRMIETGRVHDRAADVTTGLDAMAGWIASALPLKETRPNGEAITLFQGRPGGLSFLTLSNGDAQPGGMLAVTISFAGLGSSQRTGAVVFDAVPLAVGQAAALATGGAQGQVLFANVASIQFSYFGSLMEGAPARWHDEWKDATRLPRLVALRAGLNTKGRPEVVDLTFRVFSE
jgi:general secretion pathway protein J